MEFWTEKYKPGKLDEIVSQAAAIGKIMKLMREWSPGRAFFLHGPPGTGKTLIPEVIAKEKGWMLVQVNASDKRNASSIKESLSEASKNTALFSAGKIILIDEVDGLGRGDRGGAGTIAKIIKESRFPIFLTASTASDPKFKPIKRCSKVIRLSKIDSRSIARRLEEICREEGVRVDGTITRNLSRWSSGDIRSAVNDLQMMCEGRKELTEKDFESLGFRERGSDILSVLPTIFRSKNPNAAKKVIRECDKDPDEIFWWVENNVHREFRDPVSLANAFEMLSKADLFRQRVREQQNWRLKYFMIEMLSGISLAGEASGGSVTYQFPRRFIMLSKKKFADLRLRSLLDKLGPYTHSSVSRMKSEYLPYLKLILSGCREARENSSEGGLEITEGERESIMSA